MPECVCTLKADPLVVVRFYFWQTTLPEWVWELRASILTGMGLYIEAGSPTRVFCALRTSLVTERTKSVRTKVVHKERTYKHSTLREESFPEFT